jgi:protocatechuate 3,4-dioxygenase beta subunit
MKKQSHLFEGFSMRPVFIFILIFTLAACSGPSPAAATAVPPSSVPTASGGTTPEASPAVTSAVQAGAPACAAPASQTPEVTEGPYFKAGSPERSSLLDNGMSGTKLTLTGYVLTSDCKPVDHALLDFWQADAQGQYDNAGYTLRGHQFTDANGRFQLVTVVPGEYPGRTEHIHVKIQAPNGPVLTSQLFFPGVADNSSDGIYNPALLINIQSSSSSEVQATYTFIVNGSK